MEPPRPGRLINRLRAILGLRPDSVREALEELIEERDEPEAPIDPGERELLRNILDLKDVTVYDVMVPRGKIVGVEIDTPFPEVARMMSEAAHSRLPVYREKLDDVVGMLHIKDVLAAHLQGAPDALEPLLRKVLFVPPSMHAMDCLVQMRQNRTHLALVVDEYGGIDGLVTIEDLVEQIVGEIEDEHDEIEEHTMERQPDGSVLLEGGLPIEELERLAGPFLSDEEEAEIDTVGGLVVHLAGRVPQTGEVIEHPAGLRFEIVTADPRRVGSLRLLNLPGETDGHG